MDGVDAVRYVLENNIPGAFVECGVEKGTQPLTWIQTLLAYNCTNRDIYLYDTFSGMTEPTNEDFSTQDTLMYHSDAEQTYKKWSSEQKEDHNGWCYGSLEEVKERLFQYPYPRNKIHFIKGDVLETLRILSNIPDEIALLRMDTDWYESSKIEMEILYPRVSKYGLVIMDDYYHWHGQRKATDEYLLSIGVSPILTVKRVNAKTGSFIKSAPLSKVYVL